MSISEKVRNAFRAPLPDPARLEARIAGQQALVAEIKTNHAAASLDWANSNTTGSAKTLAEIDGQLETAERELRALRAAHAAAVEQKAERERLAFAELHKTQIRAIEQHLGARDTAAAEFATALAAAIEAYKVLVKRSEKALAASPGGRAQFPMGSLCELGVIKTLIASELYRLTADSSMDQPLLFPGAKSPSLSLLQQPNKIEPLLAQIERASQHVKDVLKGRKAPAPVAAAAPAAAAIAPAASPAPAAAAPVPADDPSGDLERQTLASGGPRVDMRGYVPARRTLS
ncbi:MAG TPA: hypothetical protein VGU20_04230 [Stellaceae bacterium]|nr:hypothetical protein [Stellaceae bacterium]